MTAICLSPTSSTPGEALISPRWMTSPNLRWETSTVIELRQVLGQAASADPEEDVFQNAAAGLDTFGFAEGLDGDADGHLFVFGDLVEVHVQDLAGEGMVLDFLHQRQALGPGVIFDLEVHQEVLGDGAVDEVFHFLDLDLEILGLGLAAVNDRRHASLGTEFLGPGAPAQHPGGCVE